MKEKVTVCMNHSRTSFWLTGDEDKVMFQESQSSTFWFQLVWGLHGCGHHAVNLSPGGGLESAKRLKDMAHIFYSPCGGTKGP